jgi:hypothetical protein
MVIRRGPFSKVDKVAAWGLATLWAIGGAIGLVIAGAQMHWRLGLVAAGALGVGVLFGIGAARGRPLEWPFTRRTTRKE